MVLRKVFFWCEGVFCYGLFFWYLRFVEGFHGLCFFVREGFRCVLGVFRRKERRAIRRIFSW